MKSLYKISILIVATGLIFASCTKTASKSGGNNTPPPELNGTVQNDIRYGSNVDYYGNNVDLKLDLYTPDKTLAQSNGKYPLYVWVHGGAFLIGEKSEGANEMILMTNQGFISAAINYRLGWDRDMNGDMCSGDSASLKEAIYRAIQDVNASLRFLVANADKYKIDTSKIFIGGSSAGGVAILNTHYITQDYANQMVPGAIAKFGYINSADNNLKNTFTIKGIVSEWGGINDEMRLNKGNTVPTIFFHGELDDVIPYDIGTVFQCPDQLPAYGAKPLYDRVTSLGFEAQAYIDPNGGHGVYDDGFRANYASAFLKSIIKSNEQSGFHIVDGPDFVRGD